MPPHSLNRREPKTITSQKLKDWRACLRCRLLQARAQFAERGCPNCPMLQLSERDQEEVERNYVTSRYLGVVGHFRTGGWVKRVCKLNDRDPVNGGGMCLGLYAISVSPEATADEAIKRIAAKFSGTTGMGVYLTGGEEHMEDNLRDLVRRNLMSEDDRKEIIGGVEGKLRDSHGEMEKDENLVGGAAFGEGILNLDDDLNNNFGMNQNQNLNQNNLNGPDSPKLNRTAANPGPQMITIDGNKTDISLISLNQTQKQLGSSALSAGGILGKSVKSHGLTTGNSAGNKNASLNRILAAEGLDGVEDDDEFDDILD